MVKAMVSLAAMIAAASSWALPASAAEAGHFRSAEEICAPYLGGSIFEPTGVSGRSTATVTGRRTSAPPPALVIPRAAPPPVQVTTGNARAAPPQALILPRRPQPVAADREAYAGLPVSEIRRVADAPVSTFGVDVDTGSYANMRRMIGEGRLPPSAAVRTEEMLNYFRYAYPKPQQRNEPFSIDVDVALSPWNDDTRILRIGLSGYDLPRQQRPAANLVFLIDTSGSMNSMDKLPLVQCSLALTAERLGPRDRVSIVTYAGFTRVLLEPTGDKEAIIAAIAGLNASGSTAGGSALELAYDQARKHLRDGQVNRILLATDGDFNVGVTDRDALVDFVEREREAGISLTALGFGTGNLNDAMMEQIANHGNGNYFYIDGPAEAAKVLDDELASTLFTIAKDVKVQVEFNPAYVAEYRLLGYENRALEEQDFANDMVDAGEIGAGHQVTALYEIVPAGAQGWTSERRYEANQRPVGSGDENGELAVVRLRYKLPDGDRSVLLERPVQANGLRHARQPTGDLAFAVAVAGYGQKLREDKYLGRWSFTDSAELARGAADTALRKEFVSLAERAAKMDPVALNRQ
jgi:Ca-activated chloride channel family protein